MNRITELWEILVPTIRNDGKPFRKRYHLVWDEKVKKIAGGLTILQPSKGKRRSKTGEDYHERMIPVRIACSEEQIRQIMEMTKDYYEQLAVLAYRVSDKCIILEGEEP